MPGSLVAVEGVCRTVGNELDRDGAVASKQRDALAFRFDAEAELRPADGDRALEHVGVVGVFVQEFLVRRRNGFGRREHGVGG